MTRNTALDRQRAVQIGNSIDGGSVGTPVPNAPVESKQSRIDYSSSRSSRPRKSRFAGR